MHILILGAYCSCNLGDAVICQCVAEQLRADFPQAEITIRDVIRRDRLVPREEPPQSMLRRRRTFAKLRRAAAKAGLDLIERREKRRVAENKAHLDSVCAGNYDLAVFAGGQLFMDGYALFLEYCVEQLKARGIPVIFNACGTGPMHSKAVRRRLGAALGQENVIALSTRDDAYKVDAILGTPLRTARISDPALDTARLLRAERRPSDVVGLGVMDPNGMPYGRSLRLWREVIRELESREVKWQLFTNGDPADVVFAKKILSGLPELAGRENLIARRDVTPEGLVDTIAGYKGLISCRLHSHIIACSLDIPTVALVWDDKLPFFFGDQQCLERCFTWRATAQELVAGLEAATAKGYDRQRLDKQIQHSRAWLRGAVEAGVKP